MAAAGSLGGEDPAQADDCAIGGGACVCCLRGWTGSWQEGRVLGVKGERSDRALDGEDVPDADDRLIWYVVEEDLVIGVKERDLLEC